MKITKKQLKELILEAVITEFERDVRPPIMRALARHQEKSDWRQVTREKRPYIQGDRELQIKFTMSGNEWELEFAEEEITLWLIVSEDGFQEWKAVFPIPPGAVNPIDIENWFERKLQKFMMLQL